MVSSTERRIISSTYPYTPATVRSTLHVILVTATLLAGCADAEPAVDTIDRQLFIDTWVELRAEAINARRGAVDTSARASILNRMQVTEEDLITFAEVHGADGTYMREIWSEIAERLDSAQFDPTVPVDTAR